MKVVNNNNNNRNKCKVGRAGLFADRKWQDEVCGKGRILLFPTPSPQPSRLLPRTPMQLLGVKKEF